jgi:hypothetical protein
VQAQMVAIAGKVIHLVHINARVLVRHNLQLR